MDQNLAGFRLRGKKIDCRGRNTRAEETKYDGKIDSKIYSRFKPGKRLLSWLVQSHFPLGPTIWLSEIIDPIRLRSASNRRNGIEVFATERLKRAQNGR